ncbi:MAG: Bifunctional ligase/repressor BirA [Chlamydiae bacterium]|nr:Bifunctional ligase/repressor BirA [Chlamydiota bacterium]
MEVQRIHLKEVDSTNTWAKEHAAEFDPKKLTCVTAAVQTAGRGRFPERSWVSKRGNLHMSLFLATSPNPNLAQVLMLSAAQVVGQNVQIKWPNDLIASGKKLSGAMVETTPYGMVLGIGMNVNTAVETDQPTTSLKELSGKKWDLEKLANAIAIRFLANWNKEFRALKEEFDALLAYKGDSIICTVGGKKIQGILLGITEDGYLQIQKSDGKLICIVSGEIQQLRME